MNILVISSIVATAYMWVGLCVNVVEKSITQSIIQSIKSLSPTSSLSYSVSVSISFWRTQPRTHAPTHAHTHTHTHKSGGHNVTCTDIKVREKRCYACTICHYLVSDKTCWYCCKFCYRTDRVSSSNKTLAYRLLKGYWTTPLCWCLKGLERQLWVTKLLQTVSKQYIVPY